MKGVTTATVAVAVLGMAVWAAGRDDRAIGKVGTAEEFAPAPEFAGVTDWLNTEPLKLADQKGRVVVVHFWTNGCINCIHNYPHYVAWQDRYKENNAFLMVGVHTPEFDAEEDVDRIKAQMLKHKLTFAVAVDNDHETWKAWGNQYWPCVYLVDKAGAIRGKWAGELGDEGYNKFTQGIDALLAEPAPNEN